MCLRIGMIAGDPQAGRFRATDVRRDIGCNRVDAICVLPFRHRESFLFVAIATGKVPGLEKNIDHGVFSNTNPKRQRGDTAGRLEFRRARVPKGAERVQHVAAKVTSSVSSLALRVSMGETGQRRGAAWSC